MSNDSKNLYGFNSSEITTTMMQNSQWGAVAYLAQSEYGNMQKSTDGESGIWNNPYNEGFTKSSTNSYKMENYSTNMTGMAGTRSDNSIKRDTYTNYYSKLEGTKEDNGDTIKISYKNINSDSSEGSVYTNTYYRYYTENGQKASTTRNIYGIYDMSGGALEYMANYLEKATTDTQVASFLNYSTNRQTPYAGTGKTGSSTDRTTNYNANKAKYGDALWETSSAAAGKKAWNQNSSYFPFFEYPFFIRGGTCTDGSATGIFNYGSGWSVGGYAGGSFRVVLY